MIALSRFLPAACGLLLAARAMAETGYPAPADLPGQSAYPDPLTLRSGEKVTTREQWEKQRAPELRALFQHYEYGFQPAAPAHVDAKTDREDSAALGGKATLRELTLSWGMPHVQIHLLLVTPNHHEGPSPVFLGLNFDGNHALLDDPLIRMPDAATYPNKKHGPETERAKEVTTWNIEQSIDRGYAVASFFSGDVVPDDLAMATERLKDFRPPERAESPAEDDCATLAAWAWGLSRAVDYLVTDPAIDGKKIAVVGHSRNGKAALVAGALDERFALIIPLQAGCGGTSPARVAPELIQPDGKTVVETVKRINTAFPHWFCANFKAFGDTTEKLPFDHHELMALCAPRPLLVCAATEDLWANPAGQFALLRAADPVYRLVAGEGATSMEMPEVGILVLSRLSFFIRPGKHSMTKVDWDAFLDYADVWLKGKR